MWYIFKNNQCIATCDFEPNHEDLMMRDEKAIKSNLILPLFEVSLDNDGNVIQVIPPEPDPEEVKIQALSALDAEYDSQFDALTLAWATALMDGDTKIADDRMSDKQNLRKEYNLKRGAILNG